MLIQYFIILNFILLVLVSTLLNLINNTFLEVSKKYLLFAIVLGGVIRIIFFV